MCLFHLSFVSIFFPFDNNDVRIAFEMFLNLILVLTLLSTTFHCIVRVQWNKADNALGLFFYTKLCSLLLSLNIFSVRVPAGSSIRSDGSDEEPFSEG